MAGKDKDSLRDKARSAGRETPAERAARNRVDPNVTIKAGRVVPSGGRGGRGKGK